jgi:hypothetical protein
MMLAKQLCAAVAGQVKRRFQRERAFIVTLAVCRAARLCTPVLLLQLFVGTTRSDSTGFVQIPLEWVVVEGSPIAGMSSPTAALVARIMAANTILSDAHISLIPVAPIPIIPDPNLPSPDEMGQGALAGDVQAQDGVSAEIRHLRRSARRALGETILPRRRFGIIGIAAGRFNQDDGDPTGTPFGSGIPSPIGWGWDRRQMFIVEDPTDVSGDVPPVSTRRGRSAAADQVLVAHEVGHVLGLDHRPGAGNVMNPTIGVANTDFNAPEVATMINQALRIRGSLVDPPGVFEPGPVVGDDILDMFAGNENPNPIPEYLDLDAASTVLDREKNTVAFQQELWGLIPKANLPGEMQYWTLVDVDCNKMTGTPGAALGQLGLNSTFDGTDLAILATVSSNGQQLVTVGDAWEFQDGQIFELPQGAASFSVQSDFSDGSYAEDPGLDPVPVAVSDTIVVQLNNPALRMPFLLDKPFKLQMILQPKGANLRADLLDEAELGLESLFTIPDFPDAFVVDQDGKPIAGRFVPGGLVSAVAEGLMPNSPFEVYVGEQLAAAAMTGPNGDASIAFPLEPDAPLGFHTLMFVNTGTAIAASNIIEIVAPPPGDYNRNGVVDAPDYVVWRKSLGQPNVNLVADGNGNGQIDVGDYDVWRANFGRSISGPQPEPPTGAAVPEPAASALAGATLALLLVPWRWTARIAHASCGTQGGYETWRANFGETAGVALLQPPTRPCLSQQACCC